MRVVMVPRGRGRWSPVTITWDEKRRSELPLPVDLKRGDLVPLCGRIYRVVRVEA